MTEHNGGLGNFLNEVSQTSAIKRNNMQSGEQIIFIDIDDIESNPKNFYGLRNIDELAGLIAVSNLIEPLTVSPKADGKYKLISGHRRRAAVQKLLEEGVYNERKLPCIIKTPVTIKIEQENGETVEFDEDAVEMLNLIASNRGQREERTIDEKLQEIKYLESFAKAIYNQKDRGFRGRFRNFFAEEILNISKSQLQRINAMEKLTARVKQAIDEKKISESAALEMSNMTFEEQEACLEKILSGEIKGTIQDIQAQKNLNVENLEDRVESSEKTAETAIEDISTQYSTDESNKSVESQKESTNETANETEEKLTYPQNLLPEKEKNFGRKVFDVPEEFDDPQKEAEGWFYQECVASYEEAKRLSEEETDELKAAQWGIRASVARYHIEELKLQHKN